MNFRIVLCATFIAGIAARTRYRHYQPYRDESDMTEPHHGEPYHEKPYHDEEPYHREPYHEKSYHDEEPYHKKPYHGAPYHEPPRHEEPKPYSFGYAIKDKHGEQTRHEARDDSGKVTGSYSFVDEKGIERIVQYIADHLGFRAKIITNEPGTANQNPAGVIMESRPW